MLLFLALVAVIAVRGEFNVNTAVEAETPVEPDNSEPVNGGENDYWHPVQKAVKTAKRLYRICTALLRYNRRCLKIPSRSLLMKLQAQLRALKLILFANTPGIGDAINNVNSLISLKV